MKLIESLHKYKKILLRNFKTINGKKLNRHHINYEFGDSHDKNIGDTLTIPLIDYLLNVFKLSSKCFLKPKHLYCIGSVICFGLFDAVIWGSGFLSNDFVLKLKKHKYIKYDIRAVRGPLTREALLECGYNCPSIYGDPAILYKRFYDKSVPKKYNISLITHYADCRQTNTTGIHKISVETKDYKYFIDEIRASKVVISSSLHGIILAETYGVPCIWLKANELDDFKFYDWYYSTNRGNDDIKHADTIEDAIKMSKAAIDPPVDEIDTMICGLLKVFPFDLFKKDN